MTKDTQKEIYIKLYDMKLEDFIKDGIDNSAPIYKASRKANIFAVKNTWNVFRLQKD